MLADLLVRLLGLPVVSLFTTASALRLEAKQVKKLNSGSVSPDEIMASCSVFLSVLTTYLHTPIFVITFFKLSELIIGYICMM